jgi:hypothetical protein
MKFLKALNYVLITLAAVVFIIICIFNSVIPVLDLAILKLGSTLLLGGSAVISMIIRRKKYPESRLTGSYIWLTVFFVLCAVGDFFMVDPAKYFVFGLGGYLLAHVGLIISFVCQPRYSVSDNNARYEISVFVALIAFAAGIFVYMFLYPHLIAKGIVLALLVALYSCVLIAMMFAASEVFSRASDISPRQRTQ